MSQKFLKTIVLSAVICSFGSIDLLKAEDCRQYRNKRAECIKQPTCRFKQTSGSGGMCWEDVCKPYKTSEDECTKALNGACQWNKEYSECTKKETSTTKKKGPSNWSNY